MTQSSVISDTQISFAHYRANKDSYVTQIINKKNKKITNNITVKKVTLTKTQNNQIIEEEKIEDEKEQQHNSEDEIESEILLKHKSKSKKKKINCNGE